MTDQWALWATRPSMWEIAGLLALGVGIGWAFWRYVPQVRVWLGFGAGTLFFAFLIIVRLVLFPSLALTAHILWMWLMFCVFIGGIFVTMNGLRVLSRWRRGKDVDQEFE